MFYEKAGQGRFIYGLAIHTLHFTGHMVHQNPDYRQSRLEAWMSQVAHWITITLMIYIIIELLRKIFGGSWGFQELTISLLGIIIAAIIKIKTDFNKIFKEIGGMSGDISKLHRDNSKVFSELNDLQKEIHSIDNKLSEHIGWHRGTKS